MKKRCELRLVGDFVGVHDSSGSGVKLGGDLAGSNAARCQCLKEAVFFPRLSFSGLSPFSYTFNTL